MPTVNPNAYLDVENAIKRVGGNEALYKKLLSLFLSDNHVDDLCVAIESNDLEESSKIAHATKGVCVNLSLNKLSALASDINVSAKNDQDCKQYLPELKATYDKTIELIDEYLR